MTGVIQPTGVYKNLYIRPVQPNVAGSQPAVQDTVSAPEEPQANNKKKKSRLILGATVLVVAALALVLGAQNIASFLGNSRTRKAIGRIPFTPVKDLVGSIQGRLMQAFNLMSLRTGNIFQNKFIGLFDYCRKWNKTS